MRTRFLNLLALAALATSPAIAKDKKPVDPNKKICRQSEVTGSIMPGKSVCHTAAEWTQIDNQNSQSLQAMRDHARGGTGAP